MADHPSLSRTPHPMPLDLAAPPAAPETRPTRAEGIAAALAEAITRGEIPPGTTLEEERLALAYG
ncbi:MAG: hypothetical protein ACK5V0_12680, partial [Alphaproteobacteria bacterium]